MKLYMHPASPNCVAVQAVAAELGLRLEAEPVDLFAGANRSAEFLALNPNGLVPVLQDDGFVLWETAAILQYMAAKVPAQALLPLDERERAGVTRWQSWAIAHWQPVLQVLIFQRLFKRLKGQGEADEVAVDAALPKLHNCAKILDDAFAARPWICGDRPTIADFALGAYLVYAEVAQIPLSSFEGLGAWWARLRSRPAWLRAESAMPRLSVSPV